MRLSNRHPRRRNPMPNISENQPAAAASETPRTEPRDAPRPDARPEQTGDAPPSEKIALFRALVNAGCDAELA